MGWFGVAIALSMPWLAGVRVIRRLWRDASPGVWAIALGYGYVGGLVTATLLLRVLEPLGLTFALVTSVLVFAALASPGLAWPRLPRAERVLAAIKTADWHWLLVAIVLMLLGLRVLGLTLEVWWQPLFPWDAWTTWALRARVWSELHQLIPFVAPDVWLADPGSDTRPIMAARYPLTVSLISLWSTLAYGEWNEVAAKLPWLGCMLALALAFYGQARQWGASSLQALVFLAILLSLPLLDAHVALAGYADLWQAAVVGLAAFAFLSWSRTGDRRQALLTLGALLLCPLIKQEGLVWLFLFLPAFLAARMTGSWFLATCGGLFLVTIASLMSPGMTLNLQGFGPIGIGSGIVQLPYLGRFEFAYHDAWAAVSRNLFVFDNWHLLGYVMPLAIVISLVRLARRPSQRWERAALTLVLGSLLALFTLFFFTDAYLWAAKSTSINRELLHFAPTYVFWLMTLWMVWSAHDGGGSDAGARRGKGGPLQAADS